MSVEQGETRILCDKCKDTVMEAVQIVETSWGHMDTQHWCLPCLKMKLDRTLVVKRANT